MRFPRFLDKDGTIGFAAPSFGCSTEPYKSAFLNAIKTFKDKGYQVELGPNCCAAEGIGISNIPKLCADELNEMYMSEKNDVLISCGGGELMCEILDGVDFEAMKKAEPKWFMGYSDNTNFTFLLTTICDIASIYGPCAGAFGMEPWHRSIEDSFLLLQGKKISMESYELWEKESFKNEDNPLAPYNVTQKSEAKCFIIEETGQKRAVETKENIEFSGRLIGGCLDCLVNLTGTSFDCVKEFSDKYKEDGIIWYLEACDLNVFGIRRAIWHMIHAGWFEHVKGFLIGRPYHFGEDMMGLDQYLAVTELLKSYGVPILMDLDIGHLSPMMTLINGSFASVRAEDGRVFIDMEMKP